jgi:hypothetical protein
VAAAKRSEYGREQLKIYTDYSCDSLASEPQIPMNSEEPVLRIQRHRYAEMEVHNDLPAAHDHWHNASPKIHQTTICLAIPSHDARSAALNLPSSAVRANRIQVACCPKTYKRKVEVRNISPCKCSKEDV